MGADRRRTGQAHLHIAWLHGLARAFGNGDHLDSITGEGHGQILEDPASVDLPLYSCRLCSFLVVPEEWLD